MNRKNLQSETIPCQYFRWRLIRRPSGVYYADGRANTIQLGRHSLGSRKQHEALENLRHLDLKLAVQHGRADPRVLEMQPEQLLPVSEGIALYLDYVGRAEVAGGSAKARRRYEPVTQKFAAFAEERGVRHFQQVNDDVLQAYAEYLEQQGYAYATQYLELTTLKQVINYLRERRGVPGIPHVMLKLRKVTTTSTYCFSSEQVAAMIDHCQQRRDLCWLRHVIVALATTGFRISELAQLRWPDVHLEEGVLHLPDRSRHGSRSQRERARKTKGRRERTLPIHEDLRQILEELKPHRDGRIFRGPRGGGLKPDTVLRIFRREVIKPLTPRFPSLPDEPGFADATVHSFRHFFCSQAANSGVPEQMLMSWLGHADSKMVRRYYHTDRQASRQWMAKLTYTPSAGARAAERGAIVRGDSNPETAVSEGR